MLKRAAKIAKWARSESRFQEFQQGDPIRRNEGTVEWRNILKPGMMEFPKTRNASL